MPIMSRIRKAAVAGSFYPREEGELRSSVIEYTDHPFSATCPKAIIAPHAGYIYSGPVAGSVYASLQTARDRIHRVVLIGPAHRVPVRGIAASSAAVFETPLGAVPIDDDAIAHLEEAELVQIQDAAHRDEHGLEVHLPFLQLALDSFHIVPLVVGQAAPERVAKVLELLWGGDETIIVISSDLSHFHSYDEAKEIDRKTADAIEALAPDAIQDDQACGRIPIQGLLMVAKRRGLQVHTIDLRNSGDTAGPRDEVVGYGAFAFA